MNSSNTRLLGFPGFVFGVGLSFGCAGATKAPRPQAPVVDSVARRTAERDLYRSRLASAQQALANNLALTRAAALEGFVRGVRYGHASVKCQPSWPKVDVDLAPGARKP